MTYDYGNTPALGIIGTIISIVVAIMIYNDAKERGMEPTLYVLLTCCCSWCCGGIVYLIARSNHPPGGGNRRDEYPSHTGFRPTMTSSRPSDQETQFPPETNYYGRNEDYNSSPSGTKRCAQCGEHAPIDAKFCPTCGSSQF